MRDFIETIVDDEGCIVTPHLHHALLKKFELLDNNMVALSIDATDKNRYEVLLSGVNKLRVNNFLEGNIIFDMVIYINCLNNTELLQKLYGLDSDNQYFPKILENIKNNKLSLIQITPSYGCEMLVLCSDIKIYRVNGVN
jgi:hypothetical protein